MRPRSFEAVYAARNGIFYDLKMANAAGVASLGVDYGAHERDRLLKCNPLDCLMSIQELPEWLQRHSEKKDKSALATG